MPSTPHRALSTRTRGVLALAFTCLVALRLPSLVQPPGGDQGLYAYSATRLLAGDVPYRDAWDQKPPGIAFVYAALLSVWPYPSVVALGDLIAAVATALLLIVLFRRWGSPGTGWVAALVFLAFGDPYFYRLSGVYVRGQCEPYVALAVTAGLVLLAGKGRGRWHAAAAGACLAAAIWLKYNTAAYALPLAVAAWRAGGDRDGGRAWMADLVAIAAGVAVPTGLILLYFASHGALHDLRLATIDYNLQYSNETYQGVLSVPAYLLSLPFERAHTHMLWYLGELGAVALLLRTVRDRSARIILAWLCAAVIAIAVNGARSSPNYFVQAAPALAASAAAGGALAFSRRGWASMVAVALIAVGAWRVGAEGTRWSMRWAGVPGVVENLRFDLSYVRGRIDHAAYLARFTGEEKYDAPEVEQLSSYLRDTTRPDERVFVFGFLGGDICWQAGRASASRFFWSYPVTIEFASNQPGYGSQGLLADLERHPPAVIALQREQWKSEQFFLSRPPLRAWLDAHYVRDHDTAMFSVWRRR